MIDTNETRLSSQGASGATTHGEQATLTSVAHSAFDDRDRYFQRIADGSIKVFVAVTGLPGAGKSHIMKIVGEALNIATPDRAIPRVRRASDPATEIEWSREQQGSAAEWQAKAFGHQPFPGKWYAFLTDSLIQQFNDPRNAGVFLQVGHPIDIPTLADSVRQVYPLVPFVSLHVYAPLGIVQRRLMDRPDSQPEEIQQRLSLIGKRELEDSQHLPLVQSTYGTTTLINFKADEASAFGVSVLQLKLLSPKLVEMTARNAIAAARIQCQKIARDILNPVQITFSDPRIPSPMVDVIQTQLLPALTDEGISPAIFAGLGAVLYGSPRRVSDDFDFETPWSKDAAGGVCRALTRATGEQHSMQVFAWDIAPCWGARCKLMSSLEYGSKTVDIDANIIPRFCEKADSFCYEFPYDNQDHFLRRTAVLPNGSEIALVSPERILVHKLIMGRGVEVGKFDLLDCAAILAKQELDPSVLHKLLYIQRFQLSREGIHVDHPAIREKFLELDQGRMDGTDQFLEAHGVSLPEVRRSLIKWLSMIDESQLMATMKPEDIIYRKLSAIKQSAMACRMIKSLDNISAEMHLPVDLWNGESTYARCFDEHTLRQKIGSIRDQFLLYAMHEVGQQNVTHFVNRGPETDGTPAFNSSQTGTKETI